MYDFATLSPSDFELLVRDLLHAEHGWDLTAFAHGPDGGVDLRGGERRSRIVVQCKHYQGSTFAQLRKSLKAEKAKMLVERPARYLVATSQSLSKTRHDTLAAEVTPPLRTPDDLLHRTNLNDLLRRNPQVERQHFKLWLASSEVLTRIVHSGIWARSEALLEDIQSRVRLYVKHPGYDRAAKLLDRHHVVVITGSPGVGKSLLAEMLLLTHWKADWQIIQVGADIEEAWKTSTPRGRQIFLYDDFLGQTNFGENLAKNEDANIARFAAWVSTRADKRFILTTRLQVLRQAQDEREPLRRAAFDLTTCKIEIPDYTRVAKARIIYNHLYFSDLSRKVVREYASSDHLWEVIDHANFSPRVVEQVLKRPFKSAAALIDALQDGLDRPVDLWGPSFEHGLSTLGRDLLLTLVSFPTDGVPKEELIDACPSSAGSLATNQAFKALEDTWIRFERRETTLQISFADPSCRDYVLAFLDDNPEDAVRVVEHARRLAQLELLLQYAMSEAPGRGRTTPAHPGIRTALIAKQSLVLASLDRVYQREAQAGADFARLERALAICVASAPALDARFEAWVETQIHQLRQHQPVHAARHSVTHLAELVSFLAAKITPLPGPPKDRDRVATIEWLVLAIAKSAGSEDEFDEFFELTEDEAVRPMVNPVLESMIEERLTDLIRRELEELTTLYDDPSDMRERINQLESLAELRQVATNLTYDFEEARYAISSYERYEPEEDLSPSEAAEAFRLAEEARDKSVAAKRARDDEVIRTLFTHLR